MRRETGSDARGVGLTPTLENHSRSNIFAEFGWLTDYSFCSGNTLQARCSAVLDQASAGRATLVNGVRP